MRMPRNAEGCAALTELLDRWVGILKILGVKYAPDSVTLRAKDTGQEVILWKPKQDEGGLPQPLPHSTFKYANQVQAFHTTGGVHHTLHVTSAKTPYVLASKRGEYVPERITAQAMFDICMRGEVVDPRLES